MTSHLNRARDQKEMQHLKKCWIQMKDVQLQENPCLESQTFLWTIFLKQVEPKRNHVS